MAAAMAIELPPGYTVTFSGALLPMVVAGHEAGNEIRSSMARVILGGLPSSSLLMGTA